MNFVSCFIDVASNYYYFYHDDHYTIYIYISINYKTQIKIEKSKLIQLQIVIINVSNVTPILLFYSCCCLHAVCTVRSHNSQHLV